MISLPVIGPGILFPYGLALGVCASVIALNIISISIDRAAERGKKGPVFFGFLFRIVIYGGAFWLAVKTAGVASMGAAVGLLLPHIMLYIMYGLLPALKRKFGKEKEPEMVYVADTRSMVFFKEPWLVRYNNGRAYITNKRYRKIRALRKEG